MVVLSHDPMNVSPEAIREIEVRQTYVGGRLLYDQL
jgi:predicted amidohydrolase YtcJ